MHRTEAVLHDGTNVVMDTLYHHTLISHRRWWIIISTMPSHFRTWTPFLFGLLVLFVGIFAGGYWGLYSHIANFDKILHMSGGLAIAWMALALLQNDIRMLPWYKQLLFIVSITCLVGVLWEFAEYLSNSTRYTYPLIYHYFHGGGLADTLVDLVADITGGILFTSWALWRKEV
jgi:hypothetical protein